MKIDWAYVMYLYKYLCLVFAITQLMLLHVSILSYIEF